jgi:hypothetical protein
MFRYTVAKKEHGEIVGEVVAVVCPQIVSLTG